MSQSKEIWTYFEGTWHSGSVPVLRAADHGAWLGSMVFDGARQFEGLTPDLDRHCERVNNSAKVMGMNPLLDVDEMVDLITEGLGNFARDEAVYIRPMYWPTERAAGFITPEPDSTAFCICLEALPMSTAANTATLCRTQFHRPTLETATVDAKASCLYPNNARMMREAESRGFSNALVADHQDNVAETATSNIFMAKDGDIFTPVPNGTFLNGITRQRFIKLFRNAGKTVRESTLTFDDFRNADEVFMAGNMTKVMPVTAFEDVSYDAGPIAALARELYWDWAHSQRAASD